MSDRRLTPYSGRIALEALRGQVPAEAFTPGTPARVVAPVADLSPAPGALRDRQLQFGAEVLVIDPGTEAAFVQAQADGYCGWVATEALGAPVPATHAVRAAATHVYREASIKRGEVMALGLGARLAVLETLGVFARTPGGFVPAQHIRPLDAPEADPVAVAEQLLGTPYLWGGNSRAGIDCSGLVQLALAQCGLGVPGDSDLQRAAFGPFLPEAEPTLRGDLFFWRGHVAMACDGATLIHANGHTMSVAHEPIAACLARIEAAGDSPWFGRKRPLLPKP